MKIANLRQNSSLLSFTVCQGRGCTGQSVWRVGGPRTCSDWHINQKHCKNFVSSHDFQYFPQLALLLRPGVFSTGTSRPARSCVVPQTSAGEPTGSYTAPQWFFGCSLAVLWPSPEVLVRALLIRAGQNTIGASNAKKPVVEVFQR